METIITVFKTLSEGLADITGMHMFVAYLIVLLTTTVVSVITALYVGWGLIKCIPGCIGMIGFWGLAAVLTGIGLWLNTIPAPDWMIEAGNVDDGSMYWEEDPNAYKTIPKAEVIFDDEANTNSK